MELRPLSDAASDRVRDLVRRHADETGSTVARTLLADWLAARAAFTEVLPVNYARVMAAKAQAEESGPDEAASTRAMMEAAHA